MAELCRYTISSQEEVWVRACNKFFEKHGSWDWYLVPQEVAFREIVMFARGQGHSTFIKEKVENLYKVAGVKYI
jgi:hypothetical protein